MIKEIIGVVHNDIFIESSFLRFAQIVTPKLVIRQPREIEIITLFYR